MLVIDADMPGRTRTEIWHRGRNVQRVQHYGLKNSQDPKLLPELDSRLEDWILITGDDKMPFAHADTIAAVGATIATIDPRRPAGIDLIEWRLEVVQRWVHKMHEQERGEVRRYNHKTHRLWTPLP
jgi:hypothetical protein